VWPETLLRQIIDDISATACFHGTVDEIEAWALGKHGRPGNDELRVVVHIEAAYRVMVGAMSYPYPCDLPAWDRDGRRVV